MPRFYFDIREGPRFTPDDEGLEFASLDGAEREATKAVAEIGRDRLPSGGPATSASRCATSIIGSCLR